MAIDEVSKTIGAIQAELETHGEANDLILAKLDKIDDKISYTIGKVTKLKSRVDHIEKEAVTKTSVMKVIIGGGFLSGMSGAGLIGAIKAWLGVPT